MNRKTQTRKELAAEVADLDARLQEAEETLRAMRDGDLNAADYRMLVEEMNEGAVILSAEGTILYCNRRIADMLKRPIEEIVGVGFESFVAPSTRRAFAALLEADRSAGEITLNASDASAVPLRVAVSRLPADSAAAICMVATDIRESRAIGVTNERLEREIAERLRAEHEIRKLNEELKRRTEQLAASNEELEAFSYSLSHNLRAPLRHVQGYAEMLSKDAGSTLSPEASRYLQVIASAGREVGELIDGLLLFLRMNRAEMRETHVELGALVQKGIRDLKMSTQGRNIVWKVSPLPAATGDPAMLTQVFANLLDNAVKYTRSRAAAQIEIGSAGQEDGRVILFVRDNGVGFDMKYVDKLFGVFQRLHRTDEFEGAGIGLAIVRRIIARHGGRVWAEAAPDQGAAFYFTLAPSKSVE